LKTRSKTSKLIERSLLMAGVTLVAVFLASIFHRTIASHFALWQFETAQAAAASKVSMHPLESKSDEKVDVSLWSMKRIGAYKESLLIKTEVPSAVLEIAKLGIRVPVFEGTDDLTLNRGVGRIIGSADLGTPGNIGIAGHRDGFFRGLKDISVGDEVDLVMTTEKVTYVVDQIEIVSPADVTVLEPRSAPSLTLVTCYPFYFVGDAPKRFIVHASISSRRPHVGSETQPTTFPAGARKIIKENSK
jgi:sortase A